MATETVVTGAAGVESGQAAEGAGMPQLDFATFPNQIFWLAVTLVVIYLVLTRVALPRIGAVLATRRGMIANDIAAAEELKLKALTAEKAYNQALIDARAEAMRIIAGAKADIQKDLDAAVAVADASLAAKAKEAELRIAEIRDQSTDSVTEVAKDTAGAIVAAMGGTADAATVTAAVMARLKG